MNPETRQTFIGVTGLTIVETVALLEGFDGAVLSAYFVAIIALVAPQALEQLPSLSGGA
jgi:hypothetical protein